MKTEQIRFDNNQLILKVKTSSVFVLIFSFGFSIFFTLFPIFLLNSIISTNNGENPIKFLTLVFLSLPFFFSLFLLRISLWNYLGKEIYIFENEKINFVADYSWFKDGRKEILNQDINFKSIPKGYENENKGVLIIESKQETLESVVKVPFPELEKLILTLNSNLEFRKTIKL